MRRIPPGLLALGRSDPPDCIHVAGASYHLVKVFKHDFFAWTGLYHGPAGKVVLKLGRRADILGLPAQWIGAFLARREAAAYSALAGVDAVPDFLGRWGPTGIVHRFVEGTPLARHLPVGDTFFDDLRSAIEAVHARDMAYVDLEKPNNVIVGRDGRPYLIDFQIAWRLDRRFGGGTAPARWILRRLQQADRYHLLKLQRRVRPDQLTPEQIRRSYDKPFHVRLHRWLTAPLARFRRQTLKRLDPDRDRAHERGTVT